MTKQETRQEKDLTHNRKSLMGFKQELNSIANYYSNCIDQLLQQTTITDEERLALQKELFQEIVLLPQRLALHLLNQD